MKSFNNQRKKVFIVILTILLMQSFGFAAAVSDNDGSAFITKAEFDSLKNNFQSQIDTYNTNIDNKIDTAIASYLAGISVSQDPSNMFDTVKAALGEVCFLNSVKTTNSTITTNEVLNIFRHYFQHRYSGFGYIAKFYPAMKDGTHLYWTFAVAVIRNGTSGSYSDHNSATYLLQDTNGVWSGAGTVHGTWMTKSAATMDNGSQTGLSSKSVYGTNSVSTTTNGSGKLYRYKITPTGRYVITEYDDTYYPVCVLNVYAHSYKNYAADFWTNYKGTTLQNDTTSLSLTVGSSELIKYGSLGTGTPYSDTYSGSSAEKRWSAQVYTVSTNDNVQYEKYIWGRVPGSIRCINEQASLIAGSQKTSAASVTASKINAENWEKTTGVQIKEVDLSGVAVTYTPPRQVSESKSIGDFCNDYVSTIIGETVYHGQGIRIGSMPQDGNYKVTLKFKNQNSENANVNFILTDGRVGVASTKVLNNWESVACNGSTTIERTVSFDDKGELWINCYSATNGVNLILDDVELELERS